MLVYIKRIGWLVLMVTLALGLAACNPQQASDSDSTADEGAGDAETVVRNYLTAGLTGDVEEAIALSCAADVEVIESEGAPEMEEEVSVDLSGLTLEEASSDDAKIVFNLSGEITATMGEETVTFDVAEEMPTLTLVKEEGAWKACLSEMEEE